jgi:hypothetical protein
MTIMTEGQSPSAHQRAQPGDCLIDDFAAGRWRKEL